MASPVPDGPEPAAGTAAAAAAGADGAAGGATDGAADGTTAAGIDGASVGELDGGGGTEEVKEAEDELLGACSKKAPLVGPSTKTVVVVQMVVTTTSVWTPRFSATGAARAAPAKKREAMVADFIVSDLVVEGLKCWN